MKTNTEEILANSVTGKKTMTRKQAISKAGFLAISAATTMMLLSVPKAAHASSAPATPDSQPSGGTWTKRTP
ncbi:MAG: hypothetical protein WCP85_29760 [Mariniphaga sp.]